MSEKKLYAIVCGAVLGACAICVAVKHIKQNNHTAEDAVQDVSDIIQKAKDTINLLDSAVDSLRRSTI